MPVLAPEPEPEMPPGSEMASTTKEEEGNKKISSKIDRLNEDLKNKVATRDYLKERGKNVNDINLDIRLIQIEISSLKALMTTRGGKRRRRGRRKPTKSRKTKQICKRQYLKKRSIK